jgi:diaminopimelate epimerase
MNFVEASLFFTKMHGLGNDFIFLDQRKKSFSLTSSMVRALSDRRRGIGCDQLILLSHPTRPRANISMRIFNGDGTEVGACGNATRCLGALLKEETGFPQHFIETPKNLLKTSTCEDGDVEVDMGRPLMGWDDIPLSHSLDPLCLPIQVLDFDYPSAINMGNPHLVFFVPNVDQICVERYGKELEHNPFFPEGTNVEFVEIKDRHYVRMRVWERGTGITQSCASGACAVVVAGVLKGLLEPSVTVELDGGNLQIFYDQTVVMKGPVSFVCSGVIDQRFMS